MLTIYLQPLTNYWAVGFKSKDKQAITYQYWSFLNLGKSDSKLTFLKEDFAYILVTKTKFNEWVRLSSIRLLENEKDIDFKNNNKDHRKMLNKLIIRRWMSFEQEPFLTTFAKRFSPNVYNVAMAA